MCMTHSNKGDLIGQDCEIPKWGRPELLGFLARLAVMEKFVARLCPAHPINPAKLAIKHITINMLPSVHSSTVFSQTHVLHLSVRDVHCCSQHIPFEAHSARYAAQSLASNAVLS